MFTITQVPSKCLSSSSRQHITVKVAAQHLVVASVHRNPQQDLAIIRLSQPRPNSACIQRRSTPDLAHCISFDSFHFPTFFTVITNCAKLDTEKRNLFTGLSHCYSADPRTDVIGGPIFCGSRIDGFYVRDTRGSRFFNMKTEVDVIDKAIELIENEKRLVLAG